MTAGDNALVAACRDGDRAAWMRLYRAHAPVVALFLQRLLGPERDLEDRVQEVFVAFFTTLDRYRGEGTLSTWLFGIATQVALQHRRFQFRLRRRRDAYAEWISSQPLAGTDPASTAEARAVLRVVGRVVGDLDLRQRAVWVMREWEGLDTAETAQALGIPEGTVRFRLCMARRAIDRALAEAGLEAASIAEADRVPVSVVRRLGGPRRDRS